MKIRTQSGQLVDITGKVTTTVRLPDGSFQILLHTKDKKEGDILGGYSTEAKAVHVLCGIQVAVRHPEKIRIFVMPADEEVKEYDPSRKKAPGKDAGKMSGSIEP